MSDSAVVSRSWGMALATLVSRITGFVRIVLLAAILGAALSSSFTVANQLPNLVAALVLEATFTAIFVPVLARAERDDADGGTAFVRRLVTLATLLLLVATVLSVAGAPLLVHLMLGDDAQVNVPLTTAFAYLLLPQVIFYGLSAVFMAILNTRNVFGPPAWAPVVNNVVAIATLGVYLLVPGELSLDPVEMGNAKLLVLGIGTTLGVFAQNTVLFVAIRRERVSLRPLWGIDDRLKKFGTMAAAMMLYVLISQVGLVVGTQIASTAAASGPAIYNYTWLILMLPFGIIGVTVLTVVMPRLSRNAAAEDTPAVLADLSLATRLTMVTLIPVVAFMTVGGPAMGSALFAYGNFGDTDAGYLGTAITLSAFTLIPYSMVLLQLRVFYAREQPWTPIILIVVITVVKIAASLVAPFLTSDPDLVAGYLGTANGLGFLAGAAVGHVMLRANLNPRGGRLLDVQVVRTILVTVAASLLAGLTAYVVDQLSGLELLTKWGGGGGSVLRLLALGLIMLPIVAAVLTGARVPEALAAVDAIRRRLRPRRAASGPGVAAPAAVSIGVPMPSHRPPPRGPLTYSEQSDSYPGPPAASAGVRLRRGPAVTDDFAGGSGFGPDGGATTRIPRSSADDFLPDVPPEKAPPPPPPPPPTSGRPPADYGGDPTREPVVFGLPTEPPIEAATAEEDVNLRPGATIAGGRYRLLVFHGGPEHLQFWHALDTSNDVQVALTFVDPDAELPDAHLQEILGRTLKLAQIETPGVARILDVALTGSGGVVISEWIRGGSLKEVAAAIPSAVGAARAAQTLAAAAEAAHRSGVGLSIDHPGRVRVSVEGDVVLAFPATMLTTTPEDDTRGIGAVLYALLTDRWPLPETGVASGFAPAILDPNGQPVEPRLIDRDIPFQISAAAFRAVQEGGGIRSAPTLLNLLRQATAVADRTEVITPVDEPDVPVARVRRRGRGSRRSKGLLIGLGVAGLVLAATVVGIGLFVKSLVSDVDGPLDPRAIGGSAVSSAPQTSSPPTTDVKPIKATAFSPEGTLENADAVSLSIDGDPTTAWKSEDYSSPRPFPTVKNGEGILLELPKAVVLGSVTVVVNGTGTSIQIRSSDTSSPATLEDTTQLTPPQAMNPGPNTFAITSPTPTSNVLVWITQLGDVGDKHRAEIAEITVKAAG